MSFGFGRLTYEAVTVLGLALLVGAVLGCTRNYPLLASLAQAVAWHLVYEYRATALEVVLAFAGGVLGVMLVGLLGTVIPDARRTWRRGFRVVLAVAFFVVVALSQAISEGLTVGYSLSRALWDPDVFGPLAATTVLLGLLSWIGARASASA